MISHSYFTGWACALVDSDSTAICLLPAGVISFLIPKGLKVSINIILSWGLLSFLLRCWLGFSLLWSFVVSWHIMVYWFVVDWLVVNSWVFIVVLKMIIVMVVNDEMVLSVFGLIGFVDSLWINMVVIIVVVIMVIIVMVGISMVASIEAIDEWVVIHSFVVSICIVVIAMMIIVVSINDVVITVIVVVVIMVFVMVIVIHVVFAMWCFKSIVMISHGWAEMSGVVMFVTVSMVSSSPFSVVSSCPFSMVSESPFSMVSGCPFTMISVSLMMSIINVWSFMRGKVLRMMRCFMVWNLMVRSGPVGIVCIFWVR